VAPAVDVKNYDPATSRTLQGPMGVDLDTIPEGKGDMFMRYIPDKNVVLCACAKCGTTSLFEYAYELETGKNWQSLYNNSWPYAQELGEGDRWEGKMVLVNDTAEQDKIMKSAYSMAVVRDPKERLISAWKSKLACDEEYGVDVDDRHHFVHDPDHVAWPRGFVFGFQKVYGAEENMTCLTLPMFAEGLLQIKKLGRLHLLDRHFLPQNEGCFNTYPATQWSRVASIGEQEAFDELAEKMGAKPLKMIESHASTKKAFISQEVADKLDEVTKDEYEMIAAFLPKDHKSRIVAGESY